MTIARYSVSLLKEQLVFSAAHFITFNGNICERLHGHNYRVKCEVDGELDENSYVVDFIALRNQLLEIVLELDHHVLLPTQHPQIQVAQNDREVTARFEDRRWVFPAEDCCLLPVANTTAELLAWYLGGELIRRFPPESAANLRRLRMSVDENHGQWATCEIDWALPLA